jgi:hypothetical protein
MTALIYVPGLVLGQLQVLHLVGGADEQRRFRVRWGCCGREETMSVRALRAVREMRERSDGAKGGLACLGCIAKAHAERLAAEDAAAAAAAAARLAAAVTEERALKPRGHRQRGVVAGLNEGVPGRRRRRGCRGAWWRRGRPGRAWGWGRESISGGSGGGGHPDRSGDRGDGGGECLVGSLTTTMMMNRGEQR